MCELFSKESIKMRRVLNRGAQMFHIIKNPWAFGEKIVILYNLF